MQFRNFVHGRRHGSLHQQGRDHQEHRQERVVYRGIERLGCLAAQDERFRLSVFASPTADTTPVLASTFEGELIVAPAILPKKDLKLTGDLKISGGATITLNYL